MLVLRVADADCFNPPREWEGIVLKTAARLSSRDGTIIAGDVSLAYSFAYYNQPPTVVIAGNRNGMPSKRNKVYAGL